MSSAPTPQLHITATNLGPVSKLDASLSKHAQNMIYARNGTGKSFLTRALRYLDMHVQDQDISEAAFYLVSEEAADSRGSFALVQGTTNLGSLALHQSGNQVSANTYDRIFHVFSDDFVHAELRQRNYDLDGNIENEIQLDQTNIDTKEVEQRLDTKQKDATKARMQLQSLLETQKAEELVGKASVKRQLREFASISVDSILSATTQPELPEPSFKAILSDLDALKSIPAEPDYPAEVGLVAIPKTRLTEIDASLRKITSPSTVSEDIKNLIAANPDFFDQGLEILKHTDDASCPFCRQSVVHPPTKDRIELYIAYFADAEGKHKKELRAAWTDLKSFRTTVDERIASIARETLKFEALRKLVPSQRVVELPDFVSIAEQLGNAFEDYLSTVQAKGTAPATEVSIPKADVQGLLFTLNALIGDLNGHFNGITAAIKRSDNERKALHRSACTAFEAEFAHTNWTAINDIYELQKDVAAIQAELAALKKSQLSTSVKERVAQTFEILIASFFGKKYSFDRNDFILKRENKKMARGASRTLSDGEKTAIAFCYFIACAHKKVKSTSDYAKLFFVFDDPITSMSYDFVFAIAQTLKNMSISSSGDMSINPADIAKAKRPNLLVFTHSSYFFNICVTNNVVKDGAAFFLHKAGGEHKLSRRAQYIAPFEQHLKEVAEVHNGRDPDHTTGNAVRCVLEAIGRFCHPDKCDSLSNFITFLAGDGGFEIKSVLINNLSHGTYYDETPSPEELKEACSEAILIVERYARGQLAMVGILATGSNPHAAIVAA